VRTIELRQAVLLAVFEVRADGVYSKETFFAHYFFLDGAFG